MQQNLWKIAQKQGKDHYQYNTPKEVKRWNGSHDQLYQSLSKTLSPFSHPSKFLWVSSQQFPHHHSLFPCKPLHTLLFPPNFLERKKHAKSQFRKTRIRKNQTLIFKTWAEAIGGIKQLFIREALPRGSSRRFFFMRKNLIVSFTLTVGTQNLFPWTASSEWEEPLEAVAPNIPHCNEQSNRGLCFMQSRAIQNRGQVKKKKKK